MMRRRLGVTTLAVAMILAVVAGPRPHLHAANGHRTADDAHQAGDPTRPLIHSHASPHHHHGEPAPAHDHGSTSPAHDSMTAPAHGSDTAPAHDGDTAPAHGGDWHEDIVAIDVLVLRGASAVAPVPPALAEASLVVPMPAGTHGTPARLQPPANAPPPGGPSAPRAPPRSLLPFL